VERNQVSQKTLSASVSVPGQDAGIDHNIATDALVVSLPKIHSENLGMTFLFRNTGADGNNILVVSPKSTNKIIGGMTQASAVFHASGVAGKDVINTKATSKKGDWIALRAVSLTEWYIIGGQGIWASES
jgi:hypothetical protein